MVNAGEHSFDPWPREIPYAEGQLNPWTTTTEPVLPGACALKQEKPPQLDSHTPQLERSPRWPELEKAHAQKGRPSTAKTQ